MANEIAQADQCNTDESVKIDSAPTPAEKTDWGWSQSNVEDFFANAKSSVKELYEKNRGILTTLGLIYIAFLGARLLFAALSAIDDIPLVSPILKLIGLIYAVSFVWSHLVKEHDRQELIETFHRTKADVFGGHSPENS